MGRPRGTGNGSVWKRKRDTAWQGEWREYDANGKAKKHCVVLGHTPDMTEDQARARLNDILANRRRQKRLVRTVGPSSCLPQYVETPESLQLVHSHKRGAIAEFAVAIDLLAKGWDVYRSIDASAQCDLVCLMNGDAMRVEVKAGVVDAKGRIRADARRNIGKYDVLAVALRDGRIFYQAADLIQDAVYPNMTNEPRKLPIAWHRERTASIECVRVISGEEKANAVMWPETIEN